MFNISKRRGLAVTALTAAIALASIPSTALAHHGVNGQFDLSKTMVKEGVVTRVRYVNPHSYVYFDVTGDDSKVVN